MNSRGAATECSPGRKPGVFFRDDLSPVGAKNSFAPTGLVCQNDTYPGLAPGATLCRRSAAEYRRGFQRKLTRKGLLTLITIWTAAVIDRRYSSASVVPNVFPQPDLQQFGPRCFSLPPNPVIVSIWRRLRFGIG